MLRLAQAVTCLLTIVVAGCAAPAADTTGSPGEPSPSSEPSFTAGGPLPHAFADYGSHATVLFEGLRVHQWDPGLGGEVIEALAAGGEVFVVDGAIPLDGYSWYEVEFETTATEQFPDGIGRGWLAGQPSPAPEGGEWFIDIGQVSCPNEVDTATLARLSAWAHHNCEVQVDSVAGLIDLCYERPITPFTYEPDWAAFSCLFLRDEANTWVLPLAFPPDSAVPELTRGDLVTLTGGLGFDSAKYGACIVSGPPGVTEIQQLRWASTCQDRFVVTGGTIDGHIELPPMF